MTRAPDALHRWSRRLGWGLALAACGLVFAWYLQPTFLLTLADRLWSCF